MSMLDEELKRLSIRLDDLKLRVIPKFDTKTQVLYSRIQMMLQDDKKSAERTQLENEYAILSKELRIRSDEMHRIRQEIERLEIQRKYNR